VADRGRPEAAMTVGPTTDDQGLDEVIRFAL
jgi:hypothetical protein